MRRSDAGVFQKEAGENRVKYNSRQDDYQILAKLSSISLYILLGIDMAILVIGYLIAQSGGIALARGNLLRNVLFVVAVSELAAMEIVKRSMLSKIAPPAEGQQFDYRQLMTVTIVIAAMCSAISIYGLVAIILGSEIEVLLLFVAISLIGYQLFRIRPRDLERLRR
jgi:hypothetical protein